MTIAVIACLLQTLAPQHTMNIDSVLERDGDRYGTLGSTGRRLFTERLAPAPGMRGHFCYVHSSRLLDPLALDLSIGGEVLYPSDRKTTWRPSHVETRWGASDMQIRERKMITDDDVFLDVVEVTNTSAEPKSLDVRLRSGIAGQVARMGAVYRPVSIRSVANADPYPNGELFTGEDTYFRLWQEAEAYSAIRGFGGEDRKESASGGLVLGSGFGGEADHWVQYTFATPALRRPSILVRVARHDSPGDAREGSWRVLLDGKEVGTLDPPQTGGWGEIDEHYYWLRARLPTMSAGVHAIRFQSTRAANNTNFDGFYLTEGLFDPSNVPHTAYSQEQSEQIQYIPGKMRIGSVEYDTLAPWDTSGRAIIVLRGDRGPRRPDRVEIPVAEGRGARAVHLLGGVGGFVRSDQAGVAGNADMTIVLRYGDGTNTSFPVFLTGREAMWWSPLRNLSFPVAEDKLLQSIVLQDGGTPIAPVVVAVSLEAATAQGSKDRLVGSHRFHDVPSEAVGGGTGLAMGGVDSLERTVRLKPGETQRIVIGCAVAETQDVAEKRLAAWLAMADPLAKHVAQYQKWFDDNCPTFDCSDPYMTKLWAYRWFVTRHCLSRANTGRLRYDCFFEGMHGGWYPTQIAYSSPHIIDEVRWLRDARYAFGQSRNHTQNANSNGVFQSVRTNWVGGWYTNWIPFSMWGAYQVHPDRKFLEETVDAMAADVRGHFVEFDSDKDKLCSPPSHWPTGMEWQPAFFHFNDYDNSKPEAKLERADLVAYHYGNTRATADAYRALRKPDEALEMDRIAQDMQKAALAKLWNSADAWFYAIREHDDAEAKCQEIVGFYPFAFGLAPPALEFSRAYRFLADPEYFWNPFPLATVSKKCPAYTPAQEQWPAKGGVHTGCMWNGPTWPHANSLIANAIANGIREYPSSEWLDPDVYRRFLERFIRLHFEDGDLKRPMIQEYYHGETGAGWGCYDYFHSTYNDLIVRHVVGVIPSEGDTLIIEPIPCGLKYFRLDRVRYHGRDLSIVFDPDGHYAGSVKGLSVYLDEKLVATRPDLGELRVSIK
ncbi:MAG: hypothetical protein HRF45_06750 [Fimbriimonadia bacterium]